MIWQPFKEECLKKSITKKTIFVYNIMSYLSNIFTGCESPSMDQWYTEDSVTKAKVLGLIHFQKITSSVMVWAFILDFISMLKIWRVFWASTPAFPKDLSWFSCVSCQKKYSYLSKLWLWKRDSWWRFRRLSDDELDWLCLPSPRWPPEMFRQPFRVHRWTCRSPSWAWRRRYWWHWYRCW